MKILLVTTHLNIGGVSTYVISLAKHLHALGIDVICASSGGRLVLELEKVGIKHYQIPIQTKNELHLKMLFSFVRVLEIIDNEKVTHVHAHTRVTQVLSALIRIVRPVYYISTCHGFFKRRLTRRIFPAWGDKVIAISDPVREHLVNVFKVNKRKIVLVYNGVETKKYDVALNDFDKAELRRYFKIREGGLVVGGVSRIEKVKGYQYLIRAIPVILKQHPKTKFILFGDGKYKNKLQKLARRMDIEDKITFAGKVEDVDVALGLVDVFVHPCIWHEAFGLAILEAMAAGKPIIASNTGGVYALVKENVNGWLLPPGDSALLADAINRLLGNSEMIKTMGKNSLQIANERFSVDKMTQGIIAIYKQLQEEPVE